MTRRPDGTTIDTANNKGGETLIVVSKTSRGHFLKKVQRATKEVDDLFLPTPTDLDGPHYCVLAGSPAALGQCADQFRKLATKLEQIAEKA